jgi:hypothetical protein
MIFTLKTTIPKILTDLQKNILVGLHCMFGYQSFFGKKQISRFRPIFAIFGDIVFQKFKKFKNFTKMSFVIHVYIHSALNLHGLQKQHSGVFKNGFNVFF